MTLSGLHLLGCSLCLHYITSKIPEGNYLPMLSSGTFKRGVTERGGIRLCLPVHCLSARSDRQPYFHTNATSSSLLKDNQIVRDNRLPVHCRHLAPRRHHTVIPVATQMSLPPVCSPLFKCAQNQNGYHPKHILRIIFLRINVSVSDQ